MNKIPGISAYIKDYQISADPITTPGDIVTILCDLPDELTIADPNKEGEFIVVPVPANVPILVNQPTELKSLLTGENLKNGINNLTGKEQELAIVNILPLLKTKKPVAICKIVRRNGERPDTSNTLELYEALENAYEQLGNYPAGSIIPAEISFEDEVLKTGNLESLSSYSVYSKVLSNLNLIGLKNTENNVSIKQYIEDNKVTFDFIENSKTYKIKTDIGVKIDNEITSKYQQIIDLSKVAKQSDSQTVLDTALLPLLEKSTANDYLAMAKAETLKETYDVPQSITLQIKTDTHDYTLTVNPCDLPFVNLQENQTVGLYDLTDNLILADLVLTNKSYVFSNVTSPVTDKTIKLEKRLHQYQNQTYVLSKENLRQITVDRSFAIVEKFNKTNDTRTSNGIKINPLSSSNKFTISALLVIQSVRKDSSKAYLTVNGEEFEIPAASIDSSFNVTTEIDFNYKGLISLKLLQGLELPSSANNFEYEITIVPNGASFDKRLVQFCHQLTTDLNECIGYLGSKPPKTISSKDVQERITELTNYANQKNYADVDLDKGMYLTVTFGAHKSGGYGGITDFPEMNIKSCTGKTVQLSRGSYVNIGDKVDLITSKKGNFIIQETTVVNVVVNDDGLLVTLADNILETITNSRTTKRLQITNKKDRKGSYLATMYACFANDYDLDKAPMNAILPGESEIMYSRPQLNSLLKAKITPICREINSLKGKIIDTPTMARNESDFTDQGTVGVIFWLIRQLREICEPKKGKRFGSAAKQIVFQDELEAPFRSLLGDKILDYKLFVDFSKLETGNDLSIKFSIKEAKKLKTVSIEARMF